MMKCFIHKWSAWGLPFESTVVTSRGSFGNTSTDPVVRQERLCSKCGAVGSRIVRQGKLLSSTKEQPQ
jgi:hypothetical protein